uniref:CCHC-type domain-containing protein n=1 Tax=Strigamia maritima TaxID=126957 RepID=T1IK12_STRMM
MHVEDVEKLAMTWENMRTYILIARCGKGYENLRQIINQWSDTDFNWTKVSQALMSEENHRRFASGTSTESKESTDSKAYTTGQWNKSHREKSPGSRGGKSSANSQRSSSGPETKDRKNTLTCFNCQGQGHFARDCPSPRKPRNSDGASVSVKQKGLSSEKVKSEVDIDPVPIELGEGYSSIQVKNPNGSESHVKLNRVCYAPKFKRNLISISKIHKAGFKYTGYNDVLKVYEKTLDDCFIYEKLVEDHGLYELVGSAIKGNQVAMVSEKKEPKVSELDSNGVDTWHRRFGHFYSKGLNFLNNNENVTGLHLDKVINTIDCESCELSKSTRSGSIAYVHIPAPDRESKHSARAWKGVMLGYGMFTRGYRIWNPDLGKVKETKHVKIIERLNWKNNFNNGEIVGDDLESENRGVIRDQMKPMPNSEDDTDVDTSEEEGNHIRCTTQLTASSHTTSWAAGLKPMQLVDSPLASKVSTRRKKKLPNLVSKRVVSTFEVPNMKGWRKEVVTRQKGKTKGDRDTYFMMTKGQGLYEVMMN